MSVFRLESQVLNDPVPSPEMEVLYAPETVYKGQPFTTRVRPAPGHPPLVRTNGVEVALPPAPGETPMEFTLYPDVSTRLTFASGDREAWRFDLIRPGDRGSLEERDGFLEREGVPVVLVPDHRLPPPLDRRWETLDWLRTRLLTGKPELEEVLWLAPEDSPLVDELRKTLGDHATRRLSPDPEAWFRVHGYLMAPEPDPPAPFVAVEMDFHDLDRGMPFHVWIAKWQFLLQRLRHRTDYADGLLVGPLFDAAHQEWRGLSTESLRSLAAAHGLRYVDRSREPEVWKPRLEHQLRKEYALP